MKKYLLVLSCSKTKRKDLGLLPAIKRYDGVMFHVLKKNLPNWRDHIDLLIISAKYGFLLPDDSIEDYDQKMTKKRVVEIRPKVRRFWEKYILEKDYDEICTNVPKLYSLACDSFGVDFKKYPYNGWPGDFVSIKGGIGERQQQLKNWLLKVKNIYEKQEEPIETKPKTKIKEVKKTLLKPRKQKTPVKTLDCYLS